MEQVCTYKCVSRKKVSSDMDFREHVIDVIKGGAPAQ